MREEVPFVGELRDHEGKVCVHPVSLRRVGEVADARPAHGALVHGVGLLRAGSEKLLRRDDALVVGRDDLRERGDRAWIEVLTCQRIRLRLELRAVGAPLDPLQRMEEECQALGCERREAREVDGVLLLLPVRLQVVAVDRDARGLAEVPRVHRADEPLLQEALDHRLPDLLPTGPKVSSKRKASRPGSWPLSPGPCGSRRGLRSTGSEVFLRSLRCRLCPMTPPKMAEKT
mmetsp:Transcript_57962/g.180137  ORF Transcript_57962/g.180137 Transcript_57962/m.180137 type:complete len:231 (-) Transcript_57962:382-1074(-)